MDSRPGPTHLRSPRQVPIDHKTTLIGVDPIDTRFLYREIFQANAYGDFDLGPRALVVDVGANIGLFTLLVKQRHPDANVLAFEPVPDLAEAMRQNCAARGLSDVTVHEVALGAGERHQTQFTYYPLRPSSSTRFPERHERGKAALSSAVPERVLRRMYRGRQIHVDMAPLAGYLPGDGPVSLIKIDAVGSELDILGGIEDRQWPRIRRVLLDIQDIDGRCDAVRARLARVGFDVRVRPTPLAGDGLNLIVDAIQRG